MSDDYRVVNHANWQSRVPLHAASVDYGLDAFRADPDHLSSVVAFDRPRLGPVAGLDVVHLQCHIGTDTLSLARLGGRVTGLDFSDAALDVARRLFDECGAEGRFVEADLYRAPEVLEPGSFDLVYTGVGAIGWLPDIARWAGVVAALLRPGGRLFVRDGHPVLFSIDDERDDGALAIEYPYFERGGGVRWRTDVSYVAHEGTLEHPDTIEFNHGLGETIMALLDAGLDLSSIEEHDTVPWPALGSLMEPVDGGEFRLRDRPERLPMSFTLQARKR